MNKVRREDGRLRLDQISYEKLRQQVPRRDSWRCQSCGAMSNLEVHHKKFRSQSGHDSESNLITLCNASHKQKHGLQNFATYGTKD